ncbi:MAG: YciI family protein [Propionibacteriaceae bacterium]
MKYLILIYNNVDSRQAWQALPQVERAVGLAAYTELNEELEASGEMIVASALSDVSLTTRVLVTEGRTLTTDGPFAEAKEMLAGFYLVECAGLERAVEIAARIPEAEFGVVEVRPTMELSGFVW